MRLTWQWLVAGLAGVVGATALAACGDDNGSTDTAQDTQVDTSTDSTETAVETTDTTATETTVTETTVTETTVTETTDTSETVETLAIVINEIAPAGVPDDWIELYNAGTNTVDLSGWLLHDDDPTHTYTFPNGTLLPAGVYLAVGRGVDGFDFGLGTSDAVLLAKADETLVDQTAWTDLDVPAGANWGRFPNGSGAFKALWNPTRGAANVDNAAQQCGNHVIEPPEICDTTEFAGGACTNWGWGGGTLTCADACTRIDQSSCTAHAAALVINEVTSSGDDAIELFNGSASKVDLTGYEVGDAGGGLYTFGATTLNPGEYLVLHKDIDHTFGLGGDDLVELRKADGTVVDRADWLNGEAAVSYCRTPSGTGGFKACDVATFGVSNDL